MNHDVGIYAGFINLGLPFIFFSCCFFYLALRLHLITQVTPRIDQINGYSTTHRFKINFHQNKLYRRCFFNPDQKKKGLFKVGDWDLWLFQAEKSLARSILILIPVGVSFLAYTHTLLV